MTSPFDDPQFRAQMAKMGVVHQPGMAADLLEALAPPLKADGVDLDDLGDTDLETLNSAMARATERRNLVVRRSARYDSSRMSEVCSTLGA